jgi:hypothetical protein
MALQDRIKQERDSRIPKAVRDARTQAERDLKRTRTLLAVRRTLPAWSDGDTARAYEERTRQPGGIWDSGRLRRPVDAATEGPALNQQLHVVPGTTLAGA